MTRIFSAFFHGRGMHPVVVWFSINPHSPQIPRSARSRSPTLRRWRISPQRHGLPDLAPLYTALEEKEIPDLNIEGAAVSGDSLRLLQRGNGRAGVNAVID